MEETARSVGPGTTAEDAPVESWDVLFSYATEDAEWVKAVEDRLIDSGIRVLDPYAVPIQFWGQNRDEVVARTFPMKCPAAFVALSAAYAASDPCRRELALLSKAALTSRPSLVLPARLDETPVPEAIGSLATLDARTYSPRVAAERIRSRIREIEAGIVHGAIEIVDPTSPAANDFEEEEEALRVRHAVELLPNDLRRVVTLYHLDGLSAGQVAEVLGISQRTAQLRLYSAREMLRRVLMRVER